MGYASTLAYLRDMALLVFEETGLMPHLNPGVMSPAEIGSLREASVSMGIMPGKRCDTADGERWLPPWFPR